MLIMALFVVAVVLLLFAKLRKERKKAGIRGWVVDQDLDSRGNRVYRDSGLGISCKPDVVERNRIIEYKSAAVKGRARYGNRGFTLQRDSPEMRAAMHKVRSIMSRMRRALALHIIPRGTPTPGRCRVCTFSKECPDRAR